MVAPRGVGGGNTQLHGAAVGKGLEHGQQRQGVPAARATAATADASVLHDACV